ncbi:MAG: amino acid decarboxylase, partial [Acidobacteriota bacterium]|nr:amino acid decarboxylase [Acidobacteriota bacterium]
MTHEHARTLAAALEANPSFELLNEPSLSVVCFRHLAEGDLDEHNLRLAQAITADGRVYLAPAQVDGVTCLRVCFMNFRTDSEHVGELLHVIEELAQNAAR